MTNDPTSAAYEALVQDGFIDALIEHYLSHQERYKTADAETQELDYESFITEWSGKLSKLLAEAETRGRIDEHAKLIEHGKHHGFERLETVVEYQDGTSADIPYRHHWNDCYDKFVVASNSRINAIKGLNPYCEPLQANADGANGRTGENTQ